MSRMSAKRRACGAVAAAHRVYELAGPSIYKYHELLRIVAGGMGRQALLIPFPFALWRAIGYAAEFLPSPPLALIKLIGWNVIMSRHLMPPDLRLCR